jgi:hypothetical protein
VGGGDAVGAEAVGWIEGAMEAGFGADLEEVDGWGAVEAEDVAGDRSGQGRARGQAAVGRLRAEVEVDPEVAAGVSAAVDAAELDEEEGVGGEVVLAEDGEAGRGGEGPGEEATLGGEAGIAEVGGRGGVGRRRRR